MDRDEEEREIRVKLRAHDSGCKYKELENMRCFKNKIVVFCSTLSNIHYDMKKFFVIYECRHCWLNRDKTSYTIMLIDIFLSF